MQKLVKKFFLLYYNIFIFNNIFINIINIIIGKKDAELENAKTEFITTKLPDWMTKLEKCLSGNGYAIGSSLSLADVTIYSFVCDYFDDKEGALKSVASCPKLINSCEKVKAAAANWLSTRPDTKF